jgi:hypothetical protein
MRLAALFDAIKVQTTKINGVVVWARRQMLAKFADGDGGVFVCHSGFLLGFGSGSCLGL